MHIGDRIVLQINLFVLSPFSHLTDIPWHFPFSIPLDTHFYHTPLFEFRIPIVFYMHVHTNTCILQILSIDGRISENFATFFPLHIFPGIGIDFRKHLERTTSWNTQKKFII